MFPIYLIQNRMVKIGTLHCDQFLPFKKYQISLNNRNFVTPISNQDIKACKADSSGIKVDSNKKIDPKAKVDPKTNLKINPRTKNSTEIEAAHLKYPISKPRDSRVNHNTERAINYKNDQAKQKLAFSKNTKSASPYLGRTSNMTGLANNKTSRFNTRGPKKPRATLADKNFPGSFCLLNVKKTKNNTHCSISNMFGHQKTLWSTSGGQMNPGSSSGRRKARYTQRMIFKSAVEKLLGFGFKHLAIHTNGTTLSKRYIFRNFYKRFKIVLLKDLTNVPHNGCRAPKARRV